MTRRNGSTSSGPGSEFNAAEPQPRPRNGWSCCPRSACDGPDGGQRSRCRSGSQLSAGNRQYGRDCALAPLRNTRICSSASAEISVPLPRIAVPASIQDRVAGEVPSAESNIEGVRRRQRVSQSFAEELAHRRVPQGHEVLKFCDAADGDGSVRIWLHLLLKGRVGGVEGFPGHYQTLYRPVCGYVTELRVLASDQCCDGLYLLVCVLELAQGRACSVQHAKTQLLGRVRRLLGGEGSGTVSARRVASRTRSGPGHPSRPRRARSPPSGRLRLYRSRGRRWTDVFGDCHVCSDHLGPLPVRPAYSGRDTVADGT